MSLSTFAELKTSVASWLHRSELTDQIPDFIVLCEAMFNRELRLQTMETTVTSTVDEEYEDLPTGYLEMRAIQITGTSGHPLEYMPPEDLRLKYRSANTDMPVHYTIIGSEIQFGPAPDAAYDLEIVYYARIAALSDSATTNWMLTNNPDVYLYGSLAAAEPFIMNDKRVSLWKSLYSEAVQSVREEDRRKRASGSPLVQRIGVSA